MLKYGKTWLLIFHHLSRNGTFNSDTCLYSREEGKYSEIGSINDLVQKNNSYEFILEYPGVGEIAWKQRDSPLNVTETDVETDDIGLVITHNDYNFGKFRGLMKSSEDYSCFDCDKENLKGYWYAIGLKYDYYEVIPGPFMYNGTQYAETKVKEVKLWIMIPSEKQSCMQIKKKSHSFFVI